MRTLRILSILVLTALYLPTENTARDAAAQQLVAPTLARHDDPLPAVGSGRAVPGGQCRTPPLPDWSIQEKWTWEQVCVGEIADFNRVGRFGGALDPRTASGWPESRILRPDFLKTILLYNPYRSALTHNGVRIAGAWFRESIRLANVQLGHQLWLDRSRFDASVQLNRLSTNSVLSLDGSVFVSWLDMEGVRIDRGLFMRNVELRGDVTFQGATVNSSVYLDNTTALRPLDITGFKTMGNLSMDNSRFERVLMLGAKIGGLLTLNHAEVTELLNLNSVKIDRSLLLRGATLKEVDLRNAEIGGNVELSCSKSNTSRRCTTISGELRMAALKTTGSLFLRGGTYSGHIDLTVAIIGINLDLSDGEYASVDMTGTTVTGEFRLGSAQRPAARWGNKSVLNLRNVSVGALQDMSDAWPPTVVLQGFTYELLGGVGTDPEQELAGRDLTWWLGWLGRQPTYSPQPYRQLAAVLQESGYEGKAVDILYHRKHKDRENSGTLRAIWLWLQFLFIGYGYRPYFALGWVILLVLAGTWALKRSGEGARNGMPYGIFYSIDMILPAIKLREYHYTEVNLKRWPKYYFYFHQIMGYVLVLFLIAGLSGLTK